MPRRPGYADPETLRSELVELLTDFENYLKKEDLRQRVLKLIDAVHKLRDLGSSLIKLEGDSKSAASDRILLYFRQYTGTIIHSDGLMVVSGIQEYARRVRELRVEFGWPIVSGSTAKDLVETGELTVEDYSLLKPETYILIRDEQNRYAAHRWNVAKSIRNESGGVKSKLLKFFKENIGSPITGEELKYVAKEKANWPRRIRELRTEDGWPIKTRNTGRLDLPIGTYILEEDRQREVHDRNIPDSVQIEVFDRDNHTCRKCGWTYDKQLKGDPRHMLELHHIKHHFHGGKNDSKNLAALCNVCHDEIHRLDKKNEWDRRRFLEWLD